MEDKDYIKALEQEVARLDQLCEVLGSLSRVSYRRWRSEAVKHGQTKAILKRVLGR